MSLPWHDWQFWVASGAALAALLWIARGPISRWVLRRGGGGRARRATLTIEGRAVEKAPPRTGTGGTPPMTSR